MTIPKIASAYSIVISNFNQHQLLAWLKLLQNKDLKLISQLVYNILYNSDLNLIESQKRKLKKHTDIYLSLTNKKSTYEIKYIICNKNPSAILLIFQITNDLYG